MTFVDFIHSRKWKLIQNYIYSWGASVVLIGALFKLQHLPYSGYLLGIGLSIEAIIFFVSAFEPMMEAPDWTKVYPQLKDDYELEEGKLAVANQPNSGQLGQPGQPIKNMTQVFSDAGISDDLLRQLAKSLETLSATASGLKDVSSATIATDGFVKNLNNASNSVDLLAKSNENAANEIDKNINGLIQTYQSTSKNISESGAKISKEIEIASSTFSKQITQSTEELSSTYKSMASSVTSGFKHLDKNSEKYNENLDKINKNLAALNASYELQLKSSGKAGEVVNTYTSGVGELNKLIDKSISETQKFTESTKAFNDNLLALNKVYGNMLGALNFKK